jgi:hypothetical protein
VDYCDSPFVVTTSFSSFGVPAPDIGVIEKLLKRTNDSVKPYFIGYLLDFPLTFLGHRLSGTKYSSQVAKSAE